jgi:hypothetical protein
VTDTTQSAVPCECVDPSCPGCCGHCGRSATLVLYRVGQEDRASTAMCKPCGTDAIDSGLFDENPTKERKDQ